jgi:beta-lactamase regulating signal transducer with metallopeptidase domain
MIEMLANHLWQSTLFACAAAMLTVAFRKNGANIRFLIWLAASVKFLVPFALFVLIGNHLRWQTAPAAHALTDHTLAELSVIMNQIALPGTMMTNNFAVARMASTPIHWQWSAWTFILGIWAAGSVALICYRVFQWRTLRKVVTASTPLDVEALLPVRETTTALEPGIFGIISPVLLLPAGITTYLAPEQLDTIVAHELCHWRRKDNLTAALHMVVEALFWFHPLVWWLGGRMIVERERACDEAVVESGRPREVYAEGILKVCQLYVEPPLPCAAGVSGGTLRKRIEEIMTSPVVGNLHVAKKWLLIATGLVAIVGPVAAGVVSGPRSIALAQGPSGNSSTLPPGVPEVEMKHYTSSEWHFSLDVPKRWNTFPAVPTNSPNEVIRFASSEDGFHLLIVFRNPYAPQQGPRAYSDQIQQFLTKAGFSNFVTGETTIGSKQVLTLDFDRPAPNGGTWSCRHYFVINGTLMYVLGFGTNRRDAEFDLFDRMAKSFVSTEPAG